MANKLFQAALNKQPQTLPPIWFMRQAGRYHKHYQALRKKHSFEKLCRDPELAAEVALGPIEDFDFDVSILFSDLLFPLDAMGMGLSYESGPPTLEWHLRPENKQNLKGIDELGTQLDFQADALKATRKRLPEDKSLIGFVGAPWTLFAYAVEGGHHGGLKVAKQNLEIFGFFCQRLLPILRHNIELQLNAGAEVVMLFDTAAGEMSFSLFEELLLPQIINLASEFEGRLGYYTKGTTSTQLKQKHLLKSPLAGIGVDHRWDLRELLRAERSGFVQGNFDQALLFLDSKQLQPLLESYFLTLKAVSPEQRAGYVCGLGHGVLPETPEENVRLFIKLAREVFSA